jgi:hypothetical protein
MRERFLRHVASVTDYWAELPDKTPQERTAGVAFSILVALDGETLALPGFNVVCRPHPDDKKYCKSKGCNWTPDGCDIGGALHEQFAKMR